MSSLWAILTFVFLLLLFVVSPVLFFFRRYRRKVKWLVAISGVMAVVSVVQFDRTADAESIAQGYESLADRQKAETAGFSTAETWAAEKVVLADQLRAEQLAAQEKARDHLLEQAGQAHRDKAGDAPKPARAPVDVVSRPAETKDQACRKDLKCWSEKNWLRASTDCAQEVERLAKYTHEWTDGWLGVKFSHYRWRDKTLGHVTHLGDKIKFQNGFGAWQNMVYECDVNPANSKILDVRVKAGRL